MRLKKSKLNYTQRVNTMKKLVSIIILFLTLISCSDNNDSQTKVIQRLSKNYPKCVVDKIKLIYETASQGKTTVSKYSYNGEIVYEFDTDIAPGVGFFTVINEKCEKICGGDSGVVYNNTCVDFDKATLIEIVWIDPR